MPTTEQPFVSTAEAVCKDLAQKEFNNSFEARMGGQAALIQLAELRMGAKQAGDREAEEKIDKMMKKLMLNIAGPEGLLR